jgi:hypothetical protein
MAMGAKVYEEHMKYVASLDLESMVNNTFTEDAVYYHNLPFFEEEPPHIVRGRRAIIDALTVIAGRQGAFTVEPPTSFSESDLHVCFHCILKSPNTCGRLLNEFRLIKGDKVSHCFGYGYNLTEAREG